jgi:hypothetical protein
VGRAVLVVVGVSLGVLLGIGAYTVLGDDTPSSVGTARPAQTDFPAVDHDEVAAADLLDAWRRWRTATFYSRGSWERRLDNGDSPLRGEVVTVQNPPRRTVVRLGSLVELIDDAVRTCDSEAGGALALSCLTGRGELTYDQRVAAEVNVVEGYVSGDDRPFDVGFGTDDGCYRVENRALLPAAPWGLWAEFCFDPESGAMESARVRRDSAVDTEVMVEIRTGVTEADFDLG